MIQSVFSKSFWKSSLFLEKCGRRYKKVLCMSASRKSPGTWPWDPGLGWPRGLGDQAEGVSPRAPPSLVSLSAGAVCEVPARAVPGYSRKRAPAWGWRWVGEALRRGRQEPPTLQPLATDPSLPAVRSQNYCVLAKLRDFVASPQCQKVAQVDALKDKVRKLYTIMNSFCRRVSDATQVLFLHVVS